MVSRASKSGPGGVGLAAWLLVLALDYGLLLSWAFPQTAYWVAPPEEIRAGTPFSLELVFEECTPQAFPRPPRVKSLALKRVRVETRSRYARSRQFPRTRFVFRVLAQEVGPYEIPSFEVPTDQGRVTVPKFTFWATSGTVESPKPSGDLEPVDSVLTVPTRSVWVGQPFPVEYELLGKPGVVFEPAGPPEWSPEDLVTEGWRKAGVLYWEEEGRRGFRYQTSVLATKPGKIELPSVFQEVRVHLEGKSGGYFFSPSFHSLSVNSNTLAIEVKPLPPAPQKFSRAVGQFRLTSRLEPSEVRVGEPVTWTVEVAGVGNWPQRWGLPPREVPAEMRVVEPRPHRQRPGNSLFQGSLTEEVILIPSQPGTYRLSGVEFTYFDPVEGSFQTLRSGPASLRVLPTPPLREGPTGIFFGPWKGPPAASPIFSTETPAVLLRTEEEGACLAWAPFPLSWTFLPAALSLVTFVAFWFFLALRKAQAEDPTWIHYRETQKLYALLAGLQPKDHSYDKETRRLVAYWRKQVARYWGLAEAEPTATRWEEVLERRGASPETKKLWLTLHAEAEAFLYSKEASLPADWPLRARQALEALPLRKPPLHRYFSLRYFFPIFFLLLWCGARVGVPEPVEELRKGHFSTAIAEWTRLLSERPTDWKLRNNLGLALAQVGRWPEALAHFASAVLLWPHDSDLRWNLNLSLQKVGTVDGRVVRLSHRWEFPFIASFAEWEILWCLGLLFVSLSLFPWLFSRYRVCSPLLGAKLARGLALSGAFLGAASLTALIAYGPLGHPRAALFVKDTNLRTLPTEAEQESRLVVAGNLAIAEKEFLGWERVRLANQEVGWTRRETLVFLYAPPPPR
jgi:tetratricopeptide (TPR) repeat protein